MAVERLACPRTANPASSRVSQANRVGCETRRAARSLAANTTTTSGPMVTPSFITRSQPRECARALVPSFINGLQKYMLHEDCFVCKRRPMRCRISISKRPSGARHFLFGEGVMAHASLVPTQQHRRPPQAGDVGQDITLLDMDIGYCTLA